MKNIAMSFLLLLMSTTLLAKKEDIYVGELTCEYKENPIGIEALKPRLSWKIFSELNNQMQTAFQILAASSPEMLHPGLADLWDSGKSDSDQSILVEYKGQKLSSRQRVYWTVRIWDKDGNATSWAKPAFFEMGLLQVTDWQADWIKTGIVFDEYSYPSPIFRKEFYISKKVKSARLYCTSRGLYEFYLNGEKVGDQLFTPGWTSYENRLQYQVYDVSQMIKTQNNAAGIMLGNGWYRVFGPNLNLKEDITDMEVLAQIEIEFTDGTKQIIKTDKSWKSSTGAILKSEIYDGEVYDARLEKTGWHSPRFNDENWKGVLVTKTKKDNIINAISEPVRRIEEITPVEIIYTPEGDTILDMGQNMVGWCRLQVACPKGTIIKLRHAEVLDEDGNFHTANLRTAKQEIIYICKGEELEIYEPHFTFQGFRYVAISGYPKEVTKDILTGIVIHSDLEQTGSFRCNDELINQLQHNIVWAQKGNFLDVPTDCPQRNERFGWTGDAQIFASTACFNMNSATFWAKWLHDLAAEQNNAGIPPHTVPSVYQGGGLKGWEIAASGWADAAVIIPWIIYLNYGDVRILEKQYESMKVWVEYMRKEAGNSFLYRPKNKQFGDWLAYAPANRDYPGATTDKNFISSAYFYHSVNILSQVSTILNKEDDAAYYISLKGKIKKCFNKEFVTSNGRLLSNTQTSYVLALAFGLLPVEIEEKAASYLAEDVNLFGHITTGFLGTADICNVLSTYGFLEEAYHLLYRKEYPSWLYPVTKGATTIWERWDGIKPDGTFQDPIMNSFNHYAYGAVGNWLYKVVAGISPDSQKPGYKHIIIKPHPGNTMNNVKASYKSLYGTIFSEWEIKDRTMYLNVAIPPNTSASVYIPATGEKLHINGELKDFQEIISQSGLKYHFLKVEIGSGNYVFKSDYVL